MGKNPLDLEDAGDLVKALRSAEMAEKLKVQFLDPWPTTPEDPLLIDR